MSEKKDRITVPKVLERKVIGKNRKKTGDPLVVVTAYDYTMARLVDSADIDLVLVGDSLGMVVQGNSTTLPVSIDQMVYHTQCVVRGVNHALVVADMPFLSYQQSIEVAIDSAGRLLKVGASAVKLEGGVAIASTVKRLVELDIPVMGHIGLTPQSFHRMGGFKVQGKSQHQGVAGVRGAQKIIDDALALQDAGAFSIVIECVPEDLAKKISERLLIPTIGIGAGKVCDGQVLVIYDLLGMIPDMRPAFVKRYANIGDSIVDAVQRYGKEVRAGKFPGAEHSFKNSK